MISKEQLEKIAMSEEEYNLVDTDDNNSDSSKKKSWFPFGW